MRVDQSEALRYLGAPKNADAATRAAVVAAAEEIEAAAQPRTVTRVVSLTRTPEGIRADGTVLLLPGQSIAAHLKGCSRAILLCATLGAEAERLLRAAALGDLLRAAALDACASSLIEVVCDELQERLRQEYGSLTSRYSPGYGDLPLALQRDFCAVLDTARSTGVTVSASGILIPRKSVTAIIGVSPASEHSASCETCPMAERCNYRKEGKPCAAR